MRRQRERRGRDRMFEQHAFARDQIERGRRAVRPAVGAEAIRARRVQRDDEQVQIRRSHAAREVADSAPGRRGRDTAGACVREGSCGDRQQDRGRATEIPGPRGARGPAVIVHQANDSRRLDDALIEGI